MFGPGFSEDAVAEFKYEKKRQLAALWEKENADNDRMQKSFDSLLESFITIIEKFYKTGKFQGFFKKADEVDPENGTVYFSRVNLFKELTGLDDFYGHKTDAIREYDFTGKILAKTGVNVRIFPVTFTKYDVLMKFPKLPEAKVIDNREKDTSPLVAKSVEKPSPKKRRFSGCLIN